MARFAPALCAAAVLCGHAAWSDGVRISGAGHPVPAGNDFADDLPRVLLQDVSILLTERSRLTFTAFAAESGNANRLTVTGLGELTEDRDFGFSNAFRRVRPRDRMVGIFPPGPLDGLLIFTSDTGATARPGSPNFVVYVDGPPGSEFTTFFLAYDDSGDDEGIDSDFDDYVIRVDVEPAE